MENNKKKNGLAISIALFLARQSPHTIRKQFHFSSAVFGKFSAFYKVMSWQWILLYGCSLGVLMLYSVIWQLILERISLSQAYMSKGFYYGFILLWSALIFHETITWNKILGVIIITIGIVVGKKE